MSIFAAIGKFYLVEKYNKTNFAKKNVDSGFKIEV
jgi:hypothetical protein